MRTGNLEREKTSILRATADTAELTQAEGNHLLLRTWAPVKSKRAGSSADSDMACQQTMTRLRGSNLGRRVRK